VTPDVLVVLPTPAAAQPDSLAGACGSNPGIACRLVWDITHSVKAANLTDVFIAGPVHLILRIAWVLALALLLRAALIRLITRFAARAGQSAEKEENGARVLVHERRRQRADALASVLRSASSLTIFGIAFVMILGDVGLDVTPVLASAGVLGVALGFGAQSLVQDFLAGTFMLMEDQYGIGDVITVGTITGTVEAVSLRITRVRDVNGVAWHIRNGTITQAGNESHGWARAVVDFPVPYLSDVARVREVIQEAATAMWEEPVWREVILERPEIWGVQDLSLDAIVLRVTARTSPMRQWAATRELRERLMSALVAAGLAAPDAADGHGRPGSPGGAARGAALPAGRGASPGRAASPGQPTRPEQDAADGAAGPA
jgi:moderate conductance mechanosensitive channel